MANPGVDVKKLRRNLWGIVPMFSAMVALSGWMLSDLVTALQDVSERAPLVRFTPASALSPLMLVFFSAILALALLRAAMLEGRVTRVLEVGMAYLGVLIALSIAPVTLGVSLVADYVLAARGYEHCAHLQGSPNRWTRDWVRNPAWCVRGKDSAWVLEQARHLPR